MAKVTGPISTLPGSKHAVPEGTICDDCGKPAVVRIQGETDSTGSEMYDLCVGCGAKHESRNQMSGECSWCKKQADVLKPTRDYDEGSCGPVYWVCGLCKGKQQEALRRDYEELNSPRDNDLVDEYFMDAVRECEHEEDEEDFDEEVN